MRKRLHHPRRLTTFIRHAPVHLFHASKKHYFPKMRGGHPTPPRPDLLYILATWFGAIIAVSALWAISYCTDSIMIIAPFGATCVLIFAVPDSPLAQPRNVIGGHLLATAISLAFFHLLGDDWWVITLAVATTIAAMQLTRTVHPPAGADPLVVIISHAPLSFLVFPVLIGAVILVCCGVLTNNIHHDRHYPKYWW